MTYFLTRTKDPKAQDFYNYYRPSDGAVMGRADEGVPEKYAVTKEGGRWTLGPYVRCIIDRPMLLSSLPGKSPGGVLHSRGSEASVLMDALISAKIGAARVHSERDEEVRAKDAG